tara:strand:- start:8579 stop:9853 length:1275 start_codon:yes stop_codon:yes gene_type:complete
MDNQEDIKKINSVGLFALIIGAIGVSVAGFGFYQGLTSEDARPLLSWLIGIAFWLSIALGVLFLTQIWYVFHARWPTIIRRQCEHCFSALPWLFLLFLPLLLIPFVSDNPGILWKWMDGTNLLPGGHELVQDDPLYNWKAAYLNPTFFAIRAFLYFGVFIALAYFLKKWSFDTDQTGSVENIHKARRLSSVGLFLLATASTLAAIDWFKSLEYHWFSTMYGVWFFAGCMRAALSALLIYCVILSTKGYLKGVFNQAHRYDLGCMMLAFTIFWAYISFSQYFLIYNANIPEETFWYNIREHNGDGVHNSWWIISMLLIFGHFLIPFLLLLWYKTKVVIWKSIGVAVWILLFHIIDLYWNILPGKVVDLDASNGYYIRQFSVEVFDIAAIVGIGGICIWAVCSSMLKAEPIPIKDPNILKSLNHSE